MSGALIGIDAGQTSTRALLVAPDGGVIGQGTGGPFVRFDEEGGVERSRRAIQTAVRAALNDSVDARDVAAVGLGLTGFHTGGVELPLIERIVREVCPDCAIIAVGDYVTNLLGASAGAPAVAIIAGGGSVAYGVAGDGREARAGAFGWLLGDEGSAYAIGREALRAAARASDGRGVPTSLESGIARELGVSHAWDLIHVVYRPEFTRDRVALLAPLVTSAADAGDAVARRILTEAAEDLVVCTLAVVRRLYRPGESVTVYPTGGVFAAGECVLRPFRATLTAEWPTATLGEPEFPPIVGAAILARRVLGLRVDSRWLNRLRDTLPRG